MIQRRVPQQVMDRAAHAGLFVPRTENDSADLGEDDRTCAHRTRFHRHVQRCIWKALIATDSQSPVDGQKFCVRRGMVEFYRFIVCRRNNFAAANDNRADRNFTGVTRELRLSDCQSHGGDIGGRDRHRQQATLVAKGEVIAFDSDVDRIAFSKLPFEDLHGDWILQLALDHTLERARPV
jgi:hypothetical protein